MEFQKELTKLSGQEKRSVKFTVDRSKVVHLGKENLNHAHTVPSLEWAVIVQYIELGVMTDCSVKSVLSVQQ